MADHEFDKTDLLAFVTGSCSDMKRLALEKHLASCEPCRLYCQALESERQTFLRDNPYQETITLPAGQARLQVRPAAVWRPYYALAASLVIMLGAASFYYMSGREGPGYRIKGSVALKAFVRNHQGGIEKRQDNRYHPGEKIQFLYSCDASNRFILFGIDTTGTITTYYPADGDSSIALEPGQDIPLPNSILLDSYTGGERFIGFFSQKPLFVPAVKRAVLEAFETTHSIDSIRIKIPDAAIIDYPLTVTPGGQQ